MSLTLAANNGWVGGGEVMLLRCAGAAAASGYSPTIVGLDQPSDVLEHAKAEGFLGVGLPSTGSRRRYARALRAWDRHRDGVLWCHGLVPAAATMGHPHRVAHFHQRPIGTLQQSAARMAQLRTIDVLVPSHAMQSTFPEASVLPNWTPAPSLTERDSNPDELVVGYLGRISGSKGVDVLADAVGRLRQRESRSVRLVISGDTRFVTLDDARTAEVALARLGADVRLLGWQPAAEVLSMIDVLAVPSRSFESFGLTAVEAMSAGVPVVVTDAGALPEVVGPDHPWVVPAGDVEALAETLASVFAAPQPDVVRRAQARWQTNYSPQAGQAAVSALLDKWGVAPS